MIKDNKINDIKRHSLIKKSFKNLVLRNVVFNI